MDDSNQNRWKDEPALMSVHHVGKKYSRSLKRSLWYGVRDIAREVLLRKEQTEGWTREGEFWAVSDVSFDLRKGEALALIGPNGAGKSTLLKMLSGLVKPDTGRIHVFGRTGALIELGAGFDPVLSGRENIHVSAAVLGLSRHEVAELLPQIVAFSELEEFIDTPVKYYSSGMNARLSFAVAAHLNPTVFLVDEVLAVGDIDFQRKCINHMLHYLAGGGALILVSHSPYLIQSVCNRGIYIDSGRVQFAGTAVDALNVYLKKPAAGPTETSGPVDHSMGGMARQRVLNELSDLRPIAIDEVQVEGSGGEILTTGENARVKIKFRALQEREVAWGFTIWTNDQWVCITGNADFEPRKIKAGEQTLACVLPKLPLLSGTYMLKVAILEAESRQPLALFGWEDAPLAFQVQAPATFLNNAFKSLNQLVTIEVKWDSPHQEGSTPCL
jgi:lipopolysaccharide transport system ATP-binding protein